MERMEESFAAMDTTTTTTSSTWSTTSGMSKKALHWIVQNSVTSDTELAVLSNVSDTWRTWLVEYLMQLVRDPTLPAPNLLLPALLRAYATQRPPTSDKFCIAWFAPEGIQQIPWSQLVREDEILQAMLLQDSRASRDLTNSVLETPTETLEPSTQHSNANNFVATAQAITQQAAREQQSSSWPRGGVVLSNEWRGYRTPVQVLTPWGYTPAFVHQVLQALRQECPTTAMALQQQQQEEEDDDDDDDDDDAYARATLAVRGVTVARPESYCLCLDHRQGSHSHHHYQQQQQHASPLQRLRDRKDLRRSVLPRVIHRHHHHKNNNNLPPVVQFLNVDKSSAVTLMTPALACGTLREPFTIFLVGIATEDGCFLSGLKHRFEIGHMYPKDQLAEVTESSALCLFTEDWSENNNNNSNAEAAKEAAEGRDDVDMQDAESYPDDDIWIADDMSRGSAKCTCVFEGVTEKLAVLEDQDVTEGRLMRGALGPGLWHCYTIVVNGQNTKFRIDGREEPTFVHGRTEATAFLDGLTLGSDHLFGMSLCSGQGSAGEGEGAIAELAIFHGLMDTRDIQTMEKHLMEKHAIPCPAKAPWKDDDFYRQASAMFQLTGNPRGNRVPLRYFTRSPNVAWKLSNPVSNEPIKRQRIGARYDDSSSDW